MAVKATNGPPPNLGKLASALDQSQKVKAHVVEAADNRALMNAVLKETRVAVPARTTTRNQRAEEKIARAASARHAANAELVRKVAVRLGVESAPPDGKVLAESSRDELTTAKSRAGAWYCSLHDSTTGLPNRDLFLEHLDQGLLQARRHGWSLAVLFVALNDFEVINDSHGHHVADQVLKAVARRLEASVRGEDIVSRYGRDEFTCLLLDVKNRSGAVDVAHKMTQRIGVKYHLDGVGVSTSASIGVAMYPGDGTTAQELLEAADETMYREKDSRHAVDHR